MEPRKPGARAPLCLREAGRGPRRPRRAAVGGSCPWTQQRRGTSSLWDGGRHRPHQGLSRERGQGLAFRTHADARARTRGETCPRVRGARCRAIGGLGCGRQCSGPCPWWGPEYKAVCFAPGPSSQAQRPSISSAPRPESLPSPAFGTPEPRPLPVGLTVESPCPPAISHLRLPPSCGGSPRGHGLAGSLPGKGLGLRERRGPGSLQLENQGSREDAEREASAGLH